MSAELEKECLKAAWRTLAKSKYLDDIWTGIFWVFHVDMREGRKIALGECYADALPKLIKEIAKYEVSKELEGIKPPTEEEAARPPSERPKQHKSPRERG